ncbi:MAG: UbiX family flavin prenyltransferase [Eubacteriales bacterium]|nr:UbiX family flavin prenyltransferase [Eubacteriales bacterium]
MNKRIIVGISGASGLPLAVCLLKELKKLPEIETHLVYTKAAELTVDYECKCSMEEISAFSDVCYNNENMGAAIASGTFQTEGMIVLPCSMKTVSGIANGFSDNLLLRAADVTIKEQRRLVLAVRETPLSPIHLKNMLSLSRLTNVSIMPPVLTYYALPLTVQDMERHIVGKILQRFDIEMEGFKTWE